MKTQFAALLVKEMENNPEIEDMVNTLLLKYHYRYSPADRDTPGKYYGLIDDILNRSSSGYSIDHDGEATLQEWFSDDTESTEA